MYKRVLLPIADDSSERTDAALEIVRAVMAKDGVLLLLHVAETMPGYVASQIPSEALEAARREMTQMLEGVAARAGVEVRAQVLSGHGGRSIVGYASDQRVDCIVINSHRPELQDAVFGSTAAYVVRHAPCSVHVLR